MTFDHIPIELRERPQWVCWKGRLKDGKLTKMPINPQKGGMASHSKPESWGTYEQALARYQGGNGVAGIGRVFSKDDPFCGIDLDKCRDPETGSIEPWAWDVLQAFNSYAEASPSRTGIHIICKAKLPAGGRKNGRVEVYDSLRFFTMTGEVLDGSPSTPVEAQEALDKFLATHFPEAKPPAQRQHSRVDMDDQALLEKARDSKNGDRFRMLFEGNWEGCGYPSQSEADQAFCNMLAFWCGNDPERIHRLFRQSGLMREKWNKKHYGDGSTYGQKTVSKAIASSTETYSQKQAKGPNGSEKRREQAESESKQVKSISVLELLDQNFEHKTPIIGEGLLPCGAGSIFAAESGLGKSLLTIEWSIRLVMGWHIFGVEVPTSRTIKIFQVENPLEQVQFRIRKMLQGFQIANLPNKIFLSDPQIKYNLQHTSSLKRLKAEIKECGADVFILDPLSSFHTVNENDNIQMRNVLDNVTNISRETGAASIIVHHFGKPQEGRSNAYRTRGAMSIRDWCDTLISMTHRKHEHKILRQIDFIKVRNGPDRKSILLERDDNLIHEIVEEDMLVSVAKVKDVLETQFDGRVERQRDLVEAIAQECGCTQRTAVPAIKRAVEMKYITEFRVGQRNKGYQVFMK